MSKPITRVALVTIVSLVLVAVAYMTVQAAFAKAETAGAQAHLVSGLQTNFNHDRSTVSELQAVQAQNSAYSDPGAGKHHGVGCDSERNAVPQD